MTDFSDFLNERLKDEEFRREYEALQPKEEIIQAIIDARKETEFAIDKYMWTLMVVSGLSLLGASVVVLIVALVF